MIGGVLPPVVTWFSAEDQLDMETQCSHLNFLISAGVDGLFIHGSTGEFAYLSTEERKENAKQVVDHVSGRKPVLIGVSANVTSTAVELARHAERSGADAIFAAPPYYWLLSDDQLLDYYRAIGRASSLPLMAYNFPALTGHDIRADLLLRMVKEIPTLAGLKDTVDSQRHLREIIFRVKEVRPEFRVFAGFDEYFLPTLLTGGDGMIGATANFAPKLSVELYQAYGTGDFSKAVDCHRRISRLMEIYTLAAPPVSAIKEATLLQGFDGAPRCRAPLPGLDREGRRRLRDILKQVKG